KIARLCLATRCFDCHGGSRSDALVDSDAGGASAKDARARILLVFAWLVVAELQRASDGKRIELHVDRAILVGERNADAIPILLVVALGDDVGDFEGDLFHGVLSVGTAAEGA